MTSEKQPEKISVLKLRQMKKEKKPAAWVTAYTLSSAQPAESTHVDMILVGDSGGMVELGYETTNPVTMDEMIMFAKTVRRAAPHTFVIGDMPQGSYETSPRDAVRNSLRFIKEAGCDAVKCEGGRRMALQIRAVADAGILVMGHLGLTPQSTASFGGYRVQGKTKKSFEAVLEDAWALEEAGVFAILLEAMPSAPAEQIAFQLDVPVYGIGAGCGVDGQLIIMHDLLGDYQAFRPWFAKCFIPDVQEAFHQYLSQIGDARKVGRETREDGIRVLRRMAVQRYIEDVRTGKYPGEEYSYPLKAEELEELKTSKYWKDTAKEPRIIANGPAHVDSGVIVGSGVHCNGRDQEFNRGYTETPM
ncbi:MAG: 3-methyl-2-oxobutanoate hydroxymethyltransferase [Bryobacterales bacterium]|nr:3-methyl-2-oxobutanoate hydroxymethyltransferase [Bryobacterales bacterium]